MTTTPPPEYHGFVNAGGGAGLALVQLSALFPGLLVCLVLAAVVLVPLLVAGLVAAVLATPPYLVWRVVRRRRARADGYSAR
jgi:hypothetical protein